MIEIVSGDLLEAKEKYIAHACNCITQKSAGTAKAIFDKFPYANTYATRTEPNVPATIQIMGNGQDQRYIINMYSIYYPGKPKYPYSTKDGFEAFSQMMGNIVLKDLDHGHPGVRLVGNLGLTTESHDIVVVRHGSNSSAGIPSGSAWKLIS